MRKQILLLLLCTFIIYYPQHFQYKEVPQSLKSKVQASDSEIRKIKNQYFTSATLLTTYLPANYDKTGNTDYTDLLQKGIDQNSNIIFPDFPILINHFGLKLKSNSKILFQQNSKLKLKGNDKEFYTTLSFENVQNVQLYFANLEGERYHHQNNKGEWGMGIYIVHSKDIYIYKPVITKFWGDGLYIGKIDGITSSNIEVYGALIDENRRNGISVIAGNQIKISNSIISNTYGSSPEYGIDIEPNKPEDELTNIILEDNITFNNKKGGLLFALDNLQGSTSKDIFVQVKNQTDYFSEKGLEFYIDRGYNKFTVPLKGKIILNGINLNNNNIALISNHSKHSMIKLQLSNINANNIKLNYNKLNKFVKKFSIGEQEVIK